HRRAHTSLLPTPAGGTGSARASSPGSEEEAGSEVLSHCSSASESAGPAEEGAGEPCGPLGDPHVGRAVAKARQAALQGLRLALSCRTLSEFLLERRLTLADSLEKCLKKGKGEEQALAGTVLTLLCLQMGSGPEGEEVFRSLKPLLVSVLTDSAASPSARQSCATALGMCCYIAAADLEVTASGCCLYPCRRAPRGCHATSVEHGALGAVLGPSDALLPPCLSHWLQLPPLLTSSSVALRILAGETIALLFELAQDLEDLCHQDTEFLCTQLKVLATESSKYRAKTDRRRQRSIFRDILRFIEEETVRFGLECMYLDSWARQRTYQVFKEVLGSGIHHHLQNNELLREIFSLGPPLVLDAAALKASKVSRFEKLPSKRRTTARSRMRDKRADVL
uniref:Uncharacterized protein n=1 Tax=Geospiza parvula TaxID=87175 RepID=A0A8C3M7F4_GEOPR